MEVMGKGVRDQCPGGSRGEFLIGFSVLAWCWEFPWLALVH